MKWAAYSAEVEQALAEARPVVALESSVWAQGLPRPINLEVARECQEAVRAAGATPAIVWLHEGRVRFGLTESELEDLCGPRLTAKVGIGDIPAVLAKGGEGATTVSATLALAERANIQVMATGGLGGVHLQWTSRPDFSSDLTQLARSRCLTVCSGVKAVLDVPATVEMLETLGVPVLGHGTDEFPAFYRRTSGLRVDGRCDDAASLARTVLAHFALGTGTGVLVANPIPAEHDLASDTYDRALAEALSEAGRAGVRGRDVTPFLLDRMRVLTGGESVAVNRELLLNNARVAAELAVALTSS